MREVIKARAAALIADEEGSSLVEYTVLLAVIVAATIATVGLVGSWVSGKWTALQAVLP